jgi:hypothetical protein
LMTRPNQWFICIRLPETHLTLLIVPFPLSFTTTPFTMQPYKAV